MLDTLLDLARQFALLSLVSIGGISTVVPEIHRQVVEVAQRMTDREFSAIFALSQAAPGPNFLIVSLVGFFLGGVAGAVVATLAMTIPTSILTYGVVHAWDRFREARWRIALQRALAPVTVGLVLASGWVLTRAADHTWPGYAVTAGTVVLMLATRVHPLAALALGAACGLAGLV
jgi:chromate transporter